MALFSTRTDYALVLLTALAREDGFASLRVIAKRHRLPYRYVSRLAGSLKRAKILKSREGVLGGYALAKPAKSIRVADVIELFEGNFGPVRCIHSPGSCPLAKECTLKPHWKLMHQQLIATLHKYTIADFA